MYAGGGSGGCGGISGIGPRMPPTAAAGRTLHTTCAQLVGCAMGTRWARRAMRRIACATGGAPWGTLAPAPCKTVQQTIVISITAALVRKGTEHGEHNRNLRGKIIDVDQTGST